MFVCRAAQVSLPLAQVDGLPVGLSLIGPAGADERLLELAERLAAALMPHGNQTAPASQ